MMSSFHFVLFLAFICLFLTQPSTIECRPATQRITVRGHQWIVPNEPGWEAVLQEAEPIRYRLLSRCTSKIECEIAADQLHKVFLNHRVSSKYYDGSLGNDILEGGGSSIFYWG